MNAQDADERVLFDFHTATNGAAWQIVNDDVMGGISTSRFQVVPDGSAIFRGEVSLENNGGFASVRIPGRHKLAGFDAFLVCVRGDGHRYKFTVRADATFDGPLYQCSFGTKKDAWEEHRLPFDRFIPTFRGRTLTGVPALDPAKVASVGFLISDRQAGPFRLEVAWIKAMKTPPR